MSRKIITATTPELYDLGPGEYRVKKRRMKRPVMPTITSTAATASRAWKTAVPPTPNRVWRTGTP